MPGHRINQEVELLSCAALESKYFSPRMIVYEENLDWNKYLEFVLEENAQALDKQNNKNINKPRTLDYSFSHPNAVK